MRVSVIIPTVDRPEAACSVIRNLLTQSVAPHEIIVVDQSRTPSPALRDHVGIRYVHLLQRGLPNARNVGARRATGDVILFLDDDILPDRDLIRFHVENYREADVMGVGGRIVGGYDQVDSRAPVGTFHEGRGMVIRNFQWTERREVRHLPGANMSFRRDVLREVEFDVSFGGAAIGEETDFCLRVQRRGGRLIFDPRASVGHLHFKVGGVYDGRGFNHWVYWHAHNTTLFIFRHARWTARVVFLIRRLGALIFYAFRRGSPVPLLRGLQGVLRGIASHRATVTPHA